MGHGVHGPGDADQALSKPPVSSVGVIARVPQHRQREGLERQRRLEELQAELWGPFVRDPLRDGQDPVRTRSDWAASSGATEKKEIARAIRRDMPRSASSVST